MRRGAEPGLQVDPVLWRGMVGTVEVQPDRLRLLRDGGLGAAFLALLLAFPVGPVYRVIVTSFLAAIALTLLARLVRRAPQVIVSDVGMAVGTRSFGTLSPRRAVAWQDVVEVTPPAWPTHMQARQSGRIPHYPRWTERYIRKQFRIVRTSGRPLLVEGPLQGWTIESLHAEIHSRWLRSAGSVGNDGRAWSPTARSWSGTGCPSGRRAW